MQFIYADILLFTTWTNCPPQPGNVMLKSNDDGGRGFIAKLVDFGLSVQIVCGKISYEIVQIPLIIWN